MIHLILKIIISLLKHRIKINLQHKMPNEVNIIKEKLLDEIYKKGIVKPYKTDLFKLFSEFPKKLVKISIQELIDNGNIFATGLNNRRQEFFYTNFTAFLTDKGILEFEKYDFKDEMKFSIEIIRILEVIEDANEGMLDVAEIVNGMISKGSKCSEDNLKNFILVSITHTCKVNKIWPVGASQWTMMYVNIDYDTITAFGKTVLRNYKASMEENKKLYIEKIKINNKIQTIDYTYPESREIIKMRLRTNFNTVNPKYWVDSSGMKFDYDQKDFYGAILGTNIRTALRGTGFWVEESKYNDPAVKKFIDDTLIRFNPTKIPEKFQYDVAFSFASEDRENVEKLADELKKKGVKVFYDKYYKAELWGKDLSDHFKKIYGGKTSKYVIIFISKHYAIKNWTHFEFEIAMEEAKKRKEEYILPIRLDKTIIQGISRTIAIINFYEESLEDLIEIILKKIQKK